MLPVKNKVTNPRWLGLRFTIIIGFIVNITFLAVRRTCGFSGLCLPQIINFGYYGG
jgi:hypothetical protein